MFLLAYVDVILFFSNVQKAFENVVDRFLVSIEMGDIDRIGKLLGISIVNGNKDILMPEEPTIKQILIFFKVEHFKVVVALLPAESDFCAECLTTNELAEHSLYRKTARFLMHLANTV